MAGYGENIPLAELAAAGANYRNEIEDGYRHEIEDLEGYITLAERDLLTGRETYDDQVRVKEEGERGAQTQEEIFHEISRCAFEKEAQAQEDLLHEIRRCAFKNRTEFFREIGQVRTILGGLDRSIEVKMAESFLTILQS